MNKKSHTANRLDLSSASVTVPVDPERVDFEKVEQFRQLIAEGRLETPERLDAAAELMLSELRKAAG